MRGRAFEDVRTPPSKMFSWFTSKPTPTLALNSHFKFYQEDYLFRNYKWKDAPVLTTRLKAKRIQKTIRTRKEVVGNSEITLLGFLPIASSVLTRDVEETETLVKYSVEQTPEMKELVSQILEQLKDEDVKFNYGRLLGTLTPEDETHEVQVVPLIAKSIANHWYAISWLVVRTSSEDPVNEKEKPVVPPPRSLPDRVIQL